MVRLEELESREEIVAAIGETLQLDNSGRVSESSLITALHGKSLLLVLDCFERLVESASVVEDLLKHASGVCCIVTSRIVLALLREAEYALDSMPASEDLEDGVPGQSDSVSLFAESASYVKYDFSIREDNRSAVSEICTILEGIPLSIILAASRLRHISLNDLLLQVREHRLDVLKRRPGSDPLDRHAALQEVIASSFSLLSPLLKTCLIRLSVFAGGFYFEDAREICVDKLVPDLRDALDVLREHSLVQLQKNESRTRYRLLDTVREYLQVHSAGNAILEAPPYKKHAEHYCAVAQRMDAQIRLGRWKETKDGMWAEIGNLRAAIRYAADSGEDVLLSGLVDSLALFLQEIGLWTELEKLAIAGEAAMERADQKQQLARLLGTHGALARRRGDENLARELWERKLTIAEQIEDLPASADVLIDLARQAQVLNMADSAQFQAVRAAAIASQLSRRDILADALSVQAENARLKGDLSLAISLGEQAFELLRTISDVPQGSQVVIGLTLGAIYKEAGDAERAEKTLVRAAECAFEIEHTFALGRALLLLGELYEGRQHEEGAALAYLAAARIHGQLKSRLHHQADLRLAEFRREHADAEISGILQRAGRRGWKDIVARLFKASDDCIVTPGGIL